MKTLHHLQHRCSKQLVSLFLLSLTVTLLASAQETSNVFVDEMTTITTPSSSSDSEDLSSSSPPHKGCQALLKTPHIPQAKLVGPEYEASIQAANSSHGAPSVSTIDGGATSASCSNGMAGGYPCQNIDLLSLLDTSELAINLPADVALLNDIWGWTSSSGREFALVGTKHGTVFVEITDPTNPIHIGALPGHNGAIANVWRDIKTYANHAFIVAEVSGHGIQIFDLTQLLTASPNTDFTETARYNGVSNAHNIFVNEDSGYAYAVGTNTCSGGLHIVDVSTPTNPIFAACYSADGYTHDVQCVTYNGPDTTYTGKEICFASNEDTITIIDVSNKNNIVELARKSYSNDFYTHQGWLTEDHATFIFDDELDEYYGVASKTRTHVMDLSSLTNPIYGGFHEGRTGVIDHNLYVNGNFVYQAHHRAGLNVLEITDASSAQFVEKGYFDVYPANDGTAFNGAWSNYPFFPSGTIVVSGIEQGLFVLRYNSSSPPSPPSPSPTPAPTTTSDCQDDPNFKWTNKRGKEKGCNWFGKRKIRCYRKPGALDACPVSCAICDSTDDTVCGDSRMRKKACKNASFCNWNKFTNPKSCEAA